MGGLSGFDLRGSLSRFWGLSESVFFGSGSVSPFVGLGDFGLCLDRVWASCVWTDRVHPDMGPDRVQTDKVQTCRIQTDKVQTEKVWQDNQGPYRQN